MKTKKNKHAGSNTTPEPKDPLPLNENAEPAGQPHTHASHNNEEKKDASPDGVKLFCLACYLDNAVTGAEEVLGTVIKMIETNGDMAKIKEGVELAWFVIHNLLNELTTRSHGEGLPKGTVPVLPIPFVVNQQPQGEQTPVKGE